MAHCASAAGAVAVDINDTVSCVATGTESGAGDAVVVFYCVVDVVGGVRGVAVGTVRCCGGCDGIDNLLSCAAVAGGARSCAVGCDIMEGHNLSRCGKQAMAIVAAETSQREEMAISLFVSNRMTGDAGYWVRRRVGGVALPVLHGIFDILTNIDTMADSAVTLVDRIDIAHGVSDMAGHAAHCGGDHVMLC